MSGIRKVRLTYTHVYDGRCYLEWKQLLYKRQQDRISEMAYILLPQEIQDIQAVCIETQVHLRILERKDVQS